MPDRPSVPGTGANKDVAAALSAHLYHAGELLRGGRLEDAQREVAAALRLRPDDVRAQNLLGLLHFRTGRLDEARSIYQRLLGQQAEDVALRLNLGLVELRRADYPAAITHLGRVAELEPDNVRVLGYYGLALYRAGEHERARPILQRAGQTDLLQKVEAELQRNAASEPRSPDSRPDLSGQALSDEDEAPMSPPPRVAEPLPPSADSPTQLGWRAALSLGAFLRARSLGTRAGTGQFELTDEGLLLVRIASAAPSEGVGLCTTGTVASSGTLRFRPLPRATEGPAQARSFGEGEDALQLATGTGVIVLSPCGGRFTLLSLRGETLRLQKAYVFGFSASLRYDCTVLPPAPASTSGPPPQPELRELLTLRGEGELVLRAATVPYALRVLPGHRCFVELSRLVGWTGTLRPIVHAPLTPTGAPYVECRGDGYVLLEPGPDAQRPPGLDR